MYKLCFFVPESHLESVKEALFDVGAGAVGDYDSCCWQSLGTGQFRGLEASTPFLGKKGQVEQVAEYKVEMVIKDQIIKLVIDALKKAHPYEEPAYDVIKLESF
ncbi:YqfO family protein [Gammaproteobacteria bacterium]|nr:YqfO family protein [Gammaproteobacteria bacterium]